MQADAASQFENDELSHNYRRIRPTLPQVILHKILNYLDVSTNHHHAIDVGCGTGNSTELLAPFFDKIVGVDSSESQIAVAARSSQHDNISYVCGSSSELPANDQSVCLVTSVVAAHWFDSQPFLVEADRVLKPGGVLALVCYDEFYIKVAGFAELGSAITDHIMAVRAELAKKGYRPKETVNLKKQYENFDRMVPYSDRLIMRDNPNFRYAHKLTFDGLIGRCSTSSIFENCRRAEGNEDVLNNVRRTLQAMIDQHQANSASIYIVYPWYMAAYKKPSKK